MTAEVRDYIAGGYFLSRWTDERDCTGTKLRRVSMGHDHSPRRFFPETWTLSWCRESQRLGSEKLPCSESPRRTSAR